VKNILQGEVHALRSVALVGDLVAVNGETWENATTRECDRVLEGR
jgi:hypothetical protein